jgi:acetyl esterase/lipase
MVTGGKNIRLKKITNQNYYSMKNLTIKLLLTFCSFIFWFSGNAQNQNDPKQIRYRNPVFENVVLQQNTEFGESTTFAGKKDKLLLDVYSPERDKELKRPVILWFHGGGFRPGNDKTQSYVVKASNDFAKRGFVCISANYRIRQAPREDKSGTMSDALEDAMTALNWIRANHEMLKVDLNKIIIGGGSAGGMLAVNFCFKDKTNIEKWDKNGIVALINLWGSPDSSYLFSSVDKNDPPTIIVHGTADKLVPYENTVQLKKQLEINEIIHEVVTLEGADHTPVSHYNEFAEKIANFIFKLL